MKGLFNCSKDFKLLLAALDNILRDLKFSKVYGSF